MGSYKLMGRAGALFQLKRSETRERCKAQYERRVCQVAIGFFCIVTVHNITDYILITNIVQFNININGNKNNCFMGV